MTSDDVPAPSGAVAAIDCGTNSTRLLIVDGAGRAVTRLMRITRLGAGVDARRRLGTDGIERTVAALEEFRKELDAADVVAGRQVATSAVRDAANAEAFLDAATEATGIRTEVLSGDEEGRLAFAGASAELPPVPGRDVVVDIGGGSTEFIVGEEDGVRAVSIDMGCVRLTERFLRHDPPTPSELEAVGAEIDRGLERATAALPALRSLPEDSRLIGLAGTVSTLLAAELGLLTYDRARIHHGVLTYPMVRTWSDRLVGEPAAERAARPGIDVGRADVLAAGALILRRTMERLSMDRCLVSESDILDGLVLSVRGDLRGSVGGPGPS